MDLKICTKCNCEKPKSEFRVTRIGMDGVKRFRARCKKCEWTSRSLEAREEKRERERGKWKNLRYAERYLELKKQPHRVEWNRKYHAERSEKQRAQRFEETLGKHCFFMVRECEKCGKVDSIKRIRPKGMGMRYCNSCRIRITMTGVKKPIRSVVCIDCSNMFYAGNIMARRCKVCAKRHFRRKYEGDGDHRKRARRYGVLYEPIRKRVVYDRDDWTCYLCGCEVFISKTYHPQQATVDCVIPMSKAGGYIYDNVKACCMMCNASKSDNIYNAITQQAKGTAGVKSTALAANTVRISKRREVHQTKNDLCQEEATI